MNSAASWLCEVANRADFQRVVIPLQINKLDAVIGLAAGSNGVWAVVAGGAVQVAVTLGQPVQSLVLLVS